MNQDSHSAFQRAGEVKERHEKMLLSKTNVVGVGVGIRKVGGDFTGEVALVVMVRRKLPGSEIPPEDMLPDELDGVPVDVQEVGEIGAQ